MTKIFNRFHIFLSHHSYLYATIVGVGIVLFWRGVWHSVDTLHVYFDHYLSNSSVSLIDHAWWDGPVSFVVGVVLLFITRAFVSSFMGADLILSGLRIEKKIAKQTEDEVKSEVNTITEIKHTMRAISQKLEELEVQVKDHHK